MRAPRIIVAIAFAFIPVAAAVAQEGAPPVAKEMARFKPLIGNWEGSGTVRPAPGAPEMPWTSVSTTESVLGGHFVMDHMKIDVEGMPVPIIFNSVSGWDPVREQYVSFETSNMGGAGESTMHFAGNKVISASSGIEDGAVVADIWVTEFEGDAVRFTGHRSIEGGPLFVFVEGTQQRGGPGFSVGPETASTTMAPPIEQMSPLAALAGTWDLEGKWKPRGGAEAIAISGRETTEPILGGHALRSHTTGQGGGVDYEGFGFMAWCPAENCIMSVGYDNMGEYHKAKCWVEGDHLVAVSAGAYQGRPTASRGMMKLSPDVLTWKGHAMAGAEEPFLSFEGVWTRAEE